MSTFLLEVKHWIGACLLCVVLYFIASSLIDQYHTKILSGPQVSISAPVPSNKATKALQTVSEAVKDVSLASALEGRVQALSESQNTLARTLQALKAGKMAGGLAAGLSKASPKTQVISLGTEAKTVLVGPAKASSDDAIEASLKKVLAETTLKTEVTSNVKVSYEDKPFSPIFAAYTSSGATGAGYTLHSAPALSLDALVLLPTGSSKGIDLGLGVEHIFKGTSAGLGIEAGYNFGRHAPSIGLFAAVHS